MPMSGFPQLQSFLQKKQGQGQQMPQTPNQYAQPQGQAGSYTQPMQGGLASKFQQAPQQGSMQIGAMPSPGTPSTGQIGQQQFNKQQIEANRGLPGGKFNRRSF